MKTLNLIVKIPIPVPRGMTTAQFQEQLEQDRRLKVDWFSAEDGDRILVDEAYLRRAKADDLFFAFELLDVTADDTD